MDAFPTFLFDFSMQGLASLIFWTLTVVVVIK
jgi:K+ transporter